MTCYHPIKAYRSKSGPNPDTGKWPIVFDPKDGWSDMPVEVPCGQCIGCRLDRSRQWAIRCVHEASLYDRNCFITLTYDDDHYPINGSLNVEDFQRFMKRLRKKYTGFKIRFFQCGEYGELCKLCGLPRYRCQSEEGCGSFVPTLGRPHHHAILFNFDFKDKVLVTIRRGNKIYVSDELSRLWPFGFSSIGNVSFESAAYVARYVTKKITGNKAAEHYQGKKPEYITMSRRPGIAADWFKKFGTDVYPNDYVVYKSKKLKPPRYYDQLYDIDHDLKKIKKQRMLTMSKHADRYSPMVVYAKEQIKLRQADKLKRKL